MAYRSMRVEILLSEGIHCLLEILTSAEQDLAAANVLGRRLHFGAVSTAIRHWIDLFKDSTRKGG